MRELSFSGWGDLGKGVVRCSNVMLTLCLVSDFIKSILKTMKVIFKVLYQGPGLFFVIPCTDTFRFVQRIRTCLYQKQIRDYQAKLGFERNWSCFLFVLRCVDLRTVSFDVPPQEVLRLRRLNFVNNPKMFGRYWRGTVLLYLLMLWSTGEHQGIRKVEDEDFPTLI